MIDYNDPIVKKNMIEKISNENEISYRKMKRNYEPYFDFLGITKKTQLLLHKTMYDHLFEPTVEQKRCKNPSCNNEAVFGRFPFGYNKYCSKKCSSIAEPRGYHSEETKKQRKEESNLKQTNLQAWITEQIATGAQVCAGCGKPAQFYSIQNDRWRCVERVQECPATKEKIGNAISDATLGVSRLDTAELLITELEIICDYGCCRNAFYKLNGQNGVKFSCSPAYQSCDGARKYRSSFMAKKYQNPTAKKQFLDRMNATNQVKYDCNFIFQRKDFKTDIAKALQEQYGPDVTHKNFMPQYREANNQMLLNTNTYTRKPYTWPSGKTTMIQGYEDIALDQLLQTYTENQLVTGSENVPRIPYMMLERERWYYPDIYVPDENLILEVKSAYTYLKDLEQNRLKEQAVLDAGYDFIWLVYDDRDHRTLLNVDDLSDERMAA